MRCCGSGWRNGAAPGPSEAAVARSLMICSVANAALRPPWILNPAEWLDLASPPVGSGDIRSIMIAGDRDRAAVLGGEEVRAWAAEAERLSATHPTFGSGVWQEAIRRQSRLLAERLGRESAELFVAWWYGWESGLE